jgi:hypothetical protein
MLVNAAPFCAIQLLQEAQFPDAHIYRPIALSRVLRVRERRLLFSLDTGIYGG